MFVRECKCVEKCKSTLNLNLNLKCIKTKNTANLQLSFGFYSLLSFVAKKQKIIEIIFVAIINDLISLMVKYFSIQCLVADDDDDYDQV